MNSISVQDFFDTHLRVFSGHSNVRGIPFIGDGFKQSHRKAVWGMLDRGENAEEDTVERIAARTASITDYKHGSGSMEGTIAKMAQNFVGSNNLPLFEAAGQYGTRFDHECASARYIKTRLLPTFRKLFKKDDDLILTRAVSNNIEVEPLYFTPILPLVLINGAEGMGSGHSCDILSYSPEDIRKSILDMLKGKEIKDFTLLPYWNGYKGTVVREGPQVLVTGKFERKKEGRSYFIVVTELPALAEGKKYKEYLEKLEDRQDIIEFDNLSDKNGFEFIVKVSREVFEYSDEDIVKLFKLTGKATENLTVWDSSGVLNRFNSVESLLADFVAWRLERYEDRRQALIKKINQDILTASEKYRFIMFYLASVNFFKDSETNIIVAELEKQKFTMIDYLMSMPMRSLTKAKIEELKKEVDELQKYLQSTMSDDAISMYNRELKELKL